MSSCYRSVCSARQNVPPYQKTQLTALVTGGTGDGRSLLRQLEARLNSSWWTACFIKWYAVLINVVEALLATHEILKWIRGRSRGSHERTAILSDSVRHNLHLMTQIVMLLCNVSAIVGVIKSDFMLLLPYLLIHVTTLALEVNYFITGVALDWCLHTSTTKPSVVNGPTRQSLAVLAFVAFNLLIMIGATFSAATPDPSKSAPARNV
ncbi:uncharacterized protein LOC129771636 [Toxorhynchites rutilus septentrionalis]|uniref:uncharacterized protein LOC129771636 n=1 Tax=Toxorhynchites rutilus septentrionalis TaxID=329112 RepID=UPI00247A0AA6|nr:uncharacterized protein LOC129771636 [Toxorhynchites rutilus septentrionalis]